MKTLTKILLTMGAALCLPVIGTGASPKRGLCWDEAKVGLNPHHASLLSPGVSWVYNWGPSPADPAVYSESFCFVPMAWNASYNAAYIRAWLDKHPATRWLLGFNEPNFADQARMTPAQAAAAWPGLEAIAKDYDVKLVAPALNFSNSQVGGKVWGIYEWYDEFFRLYPDARVDCLALHCYMNWHAATTWFATEYFYKDLYDPANENYGKFPHLVKFLDDYKTAHGDFPHMMLTEFCGWEYDWLPDVYFQIDQMTQKVQTLERSGLVEGYAWFIGNADGGASSFPYMSVFRSNSPDSDLSELGKVYVHMSAFDSSRYYAPGETIAAKDYIDASIDDIQVKVRPNSETGSSIPLQIQLPAGGWSEYLIDVPEEGGYTFHLHGKGTTHCPVALLLDGGTAICEGKLTYRGDAWTDTELECFLPAGRHTLTLSNPGQSSFTLNALSYSSGASGIANAVTDAAIAGIYDMQGRYLGNAAEVTPHPGLYIIRHSDGTSSIRLIK